MRNPRQAGRRAGRGVRAACGGAAPRRPAAGAALLLAAVSALVAALTALALRPTGPDTAFCGASGCPQLRSSDADVASGVAMQVKSGRWSHGVPNVAEIARRRVQFPSLNNLKDQYFILWVRSEKVKNWFAINIISGSDAAANLKKFTKNDIAKAVGVDRLADYQIVKAIGMNIYQQKDEVKKQAIEMHPRLKFTSDFQFGYKEITNNTEFNKEPYKFMRPVNISVIPPEQELRNLLDEAGDAVKNVGASVTKASDNIKGFLSGFGGAGR